MICKEIYLLARSWSSLKSHRLKWFIYLINFALFARVAWSAWFTKSAICWLCFCVARTEHGWYAWLAWFVVTALGCALQLANSRFWVNFRKIEKKWRIVKREFTFGMINWKQSEISGFWEFFGKTQTWQTF